MSAKAPQRTESEHERLNRQLDQVLQELRVAMPGVQVLFAFLLAVPFQGRFAEATQFEKHVYFGTLLASALATALLIAPTAYHRIMFEQRDKPTVVRLASAFAIAGLAALAVAMNGAVLLVTSFLFGEPTWIVTVAVLAPIFAWMWFGLGAMRRMRGATSH